jgi:hypothetical protein
MCRILIKSAKEETVDVTLLHNYEHNDDDDDRGTNEVYTHQGVKS